jgi:hypothetical protein
METTVKIDKNAKYLIFDKEYDSYEILTGEELLYRLNEKECGESILTPADQIFKLGEEYKVETKLVKVNKTTK